MRTPIAELRATWTLMRDHYMAMYEPEGWNSESIATLTMFYHFLILSGARA